MSIIKSSVINLYDGGGTHQYQSKVSSDGVKLQSSTLPMNLTGTSISLTNEGGDSIVDAVGTMKSMLEQITLLNTNIDNLNTLTSDIPITPAPYKLIGLSNWFGRVRLAHANGTELTLEELTALVDQYFTYRSLSNTAILKFQNIHFNPNALEISWNMPGVQPGTDIIIIADPVEITGARDADYILTGSNASGSIIEITYADGNALSGEDKRELVGREFTYGTYSAVVRSQFTNYDATSMYLNSPLSDMTIGLEIFLI
jgi:hypothetical protein